MNSITCEEFLPALETGGPLRRRLARRHAVRCPRCAAVAARLAAIKREFAAERLNAPPPSARERLLWESATVDVGGPESAAGRPTRLAGVAAVRGWPRALTWGAGLAAAACVLLVLAVSVRHKPREIAIGPKPAEPTTGTTPSPVPPAAPSPGPPSAGVVRVESVDPADELARLSADVDQLDAEMRELRRRAERDEARRQVATALDRFGRW